MPTLSQPGQHPAAITSDLLQQEVSALQERLNHREQACSELSARQLKLVQQIESQSHEITRTKGLLEKASADLRTMKTELEARFRETAELTQLLLQKEKECSDISSELVTAKTLNEKLAAANSTASGQVEAAAESVASVRQQTSALLEFGSSYCDSIRSAWNHIASRERSASEAYRKQLHTLRSSLLGNLAAKMLRQAPLDRENEPWVDPEIEALDILRGHDYFDPDWYVAQYGEAVGASDLDPLTHFLRSGTILGFDPSPAFSTADYLTRYPDVRRAGINPLVHYIKYGAEEGRTATSSSDGRPDRAGFSTP